jgi:predicted RNase H-like HicB family nuclease
MSRKYLITLRQDAEGVAVSCPELPGCHSQGANVDEALENIRSAIAEYLEVWGEPEPKVELRELELATV